MDNRLWDEKNLVHADDSTVELIRKHRLYQAEYKKISKGEIKRGQDYHGAYDDSIANDLTELEELLCERAIMQHDRDAGNYIMEVNQVEMLWWMQQKLSKAKQAYKKLIAYTLDRGDDLSLEEAIELLKSIKPNDYPSFEEESEEE